MDDKQNEKGLEIRPALRRKSQNHPLLVPFNELGESDQKYDLNIANLTLGTILQLGYTIEKGCDKKKIEWPGSPVSPAKPASISHSLDHLEESVVESGRIDKDLLALVDFLAENAHESWASHKMSLGWAWGLSLSDSLRTHPNLVAYCDMPQSEKDLDRHVVIKILAALLKWGYHILKVPQINSQ